MGKLLVTNNNSWNTKLTSLFSKVGFTESVSKSFNGQDVTIYKKLNLNNMNYLETENISVACVGTFFYDDDFGYGALEKVSRNAEQLTIPELRKSMFGSFAFLYKVDNIIRLFVDETHTYNLYYYIKDGDYLITNTYYHIQLCANAVLDINPLLARGFRGGGLTGLDSPYQGIKSLSARNYIEIDTKKNTCIIKECELNNYAHTFSTIEDAVDLIWNRTQSLANIRSNYIKNTLFFVTGGVDSRLEFAIHEYNDDKVTLGYWMGEDLVTNGTAQDYEIHRQIADCTNKDSKCFNVTQSIQDAIESIDNMVTDKYGEYSSKYAGNRKWMGIFEDLADFECVGFGYYGEAFRALSALEMSYKSPYSLKKFVNDVFCRTGLHNVFEHNTLNDYICCELKKYFNIGDENDIEIETAYNLFNCTRFSTDSTINNLANMFVYSFPIFADKRIADLTLALPYKWVQNDSIAIRLISKWDLSLLNIPFYSSHHTVLCDKENLCIKQTRKNKVTYGIRPFIKRTFIYRHLYLNFFEKILRPKTAKNDEIFSYVMNVFRNSAVLKRVKIKPVKNRNGAELPTLATFAADIKVCDVLENEDNYSNVQL